jgi:MOSC domain-containing protein YiiM
MGRLVGIARREKKRASMELLEAAEVSEQTGVANDFRGKPGKRQVTVLSADVWRNICADLGEVIPWTMRRSNLLVEGIDLPQAAGSLLKIGNLMLRVMTEIDPCSRMDEQCQGLTESLRPDWRGGVGCSVLKGASVRLGDAVSIDADDRP